MLSSPYRFTHDVLDCPSGPSYPPEEGLGEVIVGEESEQWAPTSDGNWVMVGVRGNETSLCSTQRQLFGSASLPDEINANQKHHIRCCKAS